MVRYLMLILLSLFLFSGPAEATGKIRPIELRTIRLADSIEKIGPFEVEPELVSRVKFWISVYTKAHRWQ